MSTQGALMPDHTVSGARVVYKLSPSRVVINRGKNHGVKIGQVFLIYDLGEVIIDPIENTELGQLEIVRGRGRVVHLQENLATVNSIEVDKERIRVTTGAATRLTSILGPEETEKISDAPFDGVEVGDYCRPI